MPGHVYFKDRHSILGVNQTEAFPDAYAQLIPENEVHQFPRISFRRATYYRSIGTNVKGWTMYVKYAGWPANDKFIPATTLMFIDDKNRYNLLEMSRSAVETCGDKSFPVNKTERDQYCCFILNKAKSHYSRSITTLEVVEIVASKIEEWINVQGSHMNTPPPLPTTV